MKYMIQLTALVIYIGISEGFSKLTGISPLASFIIVPVAFFVFCLIYFTIRETDIHSLH